MVYKLVITKFAPNPYYDADKAYDRDLTVEQPEIENRVLEVELTEEEYKAFKKSALELK
jgi:hypothetical protein